ncbi:MAG: PIN domain-containing protein [Ignavibacteria bacterium]|nr:PIN domain-containing protein [Ignavibacteria bacterium]
MNYTTDDIFFFDSNILIYLVDIDLEKKHKTSSLLLDEQSYISTQVINENVNICLKKLKLNKDETFRHGKFLIDKFNLVLIDKDIIYKAFDIMNKYLYSYWDSLIISAAIKCNSSILFSEDMQNNQTIEGKLRIINPFRT